MAGSVVQRLDEGLVERLQVEADRRGVDRREMVEAMLSAIMDQIDMGRRFRTPGELEEALLEITPAWYRPSSEEAKAGVEVHPVEIDKLPSGVRRGA